MKITRQPVERLEARFKRFMAACPDIEIIDDLIPTHANLGRRRADYLALNRKAVVELKVLQTDTSPKVQKELEKHRDREEYPLFYGRVDVQKVLQHLPDGEQIRRRIYRNITRSVEDALSSADKQIRDTADIFGLTNPAGLLVFLNESVSILAPEVIVHKVSQLLCNSKTYSRFLHVHLVWMIFESHLVTLANGTTAFPCVLLEGPSLEHNRLLSSFCDNLQVRWARFGNAPLKWSNAERITELECSSKPDTNEADRVELTRQEVWELRYKSAPYLRSMSDEEVLAHGAKAFKTLMPYFLKGGPRIPFEQLEPLMVQWSDFLQEAKHRGLDLRKMNVNV